MSNPGSDKWNADIACRGCGKQFGFEMAVEKALISVNLFTNHRSIKDGGEPVSIDCPNCFKETYDLEEDVCLICEESVERECQLCGSHIPFSELDGSGNCGYCNHMISKDD